MDYPRNKGSIMPIPKIIHYCWLGGQPLSELAELCIQSWRKFCPDYEIKRWDESNLNLQECPYAQAAFEAKKWAFVPDYFRQQVVYHHGGIYLDTDVELMQSLDDLLVLDSFVGLERCHTPKDKAVIAMGLGFGAVPKHPLMRRIMDAYLAIEPMYKPSGRLKTVPAPKLEQPIYQALGFVPANKIQVLHVENRSTSVFPSEVFSPLTTFGELNFSEQTRSVHHYAGSWLTQRKKLRTCLKHMSRKHYGRFLGRLHYMLHMLGYDLLNKPINFPPYELSEHDRHYREHSMVKHLQHKDACNIQILMRW
jgi:mannosyltransferase OCH1-like enzyme